MPKRLITPIVLLLFLIGMVFTTLGCNIFGWTAGDDTLDGYLAQGKQHMRNAEYTEAKAEFAKAIEAEPNNADARYYHAKATILAAGLNIGTILDELQVSETGEELPLYSRDTSKTLVEDIAYKNNMYQANLSAYDDLTEIYEGHATGNFTPLDVEVDMAVTISILAIVGLRDTDQDGDIDSTDLYLEFTAQSDGTYLIGGDGIQEFFDYNPGGGQSPMASYDTTGAHYFNALLAWSEDLLTSGRQVIVSLLLRIDPELDIEEINELIDDILDTIQKYYVNTGSAGNPGIGDNDEDGNIDDEHWGDPNGNRDNDGYLWEDATCEY